MTFDEQLKRAFDTLTDRLRDEMSRQVQNAIDELAVSARNDRDRAIAEAREEVERAAGDSLTAAVADAEARGRERGREEREREEREREEREREEREREEREEEIQPQTADPAAIERLADAIRTIDHARSLTEILDTLVSGAGREAARVGVLLVRGDRFHGWRFTGFGPSLDGQQPLEIASEDAGVIAEALRAGAVRSGGDAIQGAAPSFAEPPPAQAAVAVPIAMSGQVVAVLYADEGPANPESPIPNPRSPIPNPESRIPTLEVLARHAARCLEALTAFKAARALLAPPDSGAAREEAPAGHETSADEDAAALRYARLLVSEIKLYHEGEVLTGRRERDLATRLGGEIARARVLYEQRVPPNVRQHTDYFHHELVRTLANGDASLLELGT